MKRTLRFPPLRLTPCSTLLLLALLLQIQFLAAQESPGPKPRPWDKSERERIEAWESLSPEQREKLRQTLREIWTDPAVINAREEVKHATEAYQVAVKSAVERADPAVAELLAKVQGPGGAPMAPGPDGPGPGGRRGFDEQIRPPGFLESLSPEMRDRFRKAETAALDSVPVKAARAELGRIRDEDEALRRRRLEAHRKLRRITVEEMIRIDPSIAEVQKRLWSGDRNSLPDKRKDADGKVGKEGKPEKQERPEKADKPAKTGDAEPVQGEAGKKDTE